MTQRRVCASAVLALLLCSSCARARHTPIASGSETTQRDLQDLVEGSGGSVELDFTSLQNFFAIEETTQARPTNEELRERILGDINDFVQLIPADQVMATIVDRFKTDVDVREAIVYLTGADFRRQLDIIADDETMNEFENWFWQADVDVRIVLKRMGKYLGVAKLWELSANADIWASRPVNQNASHVPTGAINKLLEDLLALIPQDEVFILFFEKLDSSMEFVKLIEIVGNRQFLESFETVKREKLLEVTANQMYKNHIDICKLLDILAKHFLLGMFPTDDTAFCPIQRLSVRSEID